MGMTQHQLEQAILSTRGWTSERLDDEVARATPRWVPAWFRFLWRISWLKKQEEFDPPLLLSAFAKVPKSRPAEKIAVKTRAKPAPPPMPGKDQPQLKSTTATGSPSQPGSNPKKP